MSNFSTSSHKNQKF